MINHKDKCIVCGARLNDFSLGTCDGICHRANKSGRTRGQQIRVELKAMIMRPWGDEIAPDPFAYRPDNDYNLPSVATV